MIRYPFSRIHAFQSTPSAWRETHSDRIHDGCKTISIHSLRMEGDHLPHPSAKLLNISIHSLRMEGDTNKLPYSLRESISIHSLRMEGDLVLGMYSIRVLGFQSTPSAWRETNVSDAQPEDRTFQSTPSAWRETGVGLWKPLTLLFQSTPSAWRETSGTVYIFRQLGISIHSLRMEGDAGETSIHTNHR